jgi:signal transduction histidine kinase
MDDVVAISKTEVMSLDLRREVVDICTFCQTVVAEVQGSTTTHDLEFNMLEDCGTVLLDKKLMRQVIYNLLSNAIKYSPSGSTIYFDLECVASQISLRVRDQGIGIPADDLEQLFDVYYRAQNVGTIQGSGLGLPIIKRAVEAHGGKVSVESEVNRGTTFTVILPREPLAVPE